MRPSPRWRRASASPGSGSLSPPCSAALREALGSARPALVDVVTEPWQTPITAHRKAVANGATTGYGG